MAGGHPMERGNLKRLKPFPAMFALAGIALCLEPCVAQQADGGPSLSGNGGKVVISVTVGSVATHASGGKGARASTCIGAVAPGPAGEPVSVEVNGKTRDTGNDCIDDSTVINENQRHDHR